MLNCGAMVDVRKALKLGHDEDIRVFVIDSHRPVHLSNVHGTSLVFRLPRVSTGVSKQSSEGRETYQTPFTHYRSIFLLLAPEEMIAVFDEGTANDIPVNH